MLAKSIQRHSGEDGLVLALFGPWGSGKTTVLGYVCHFIDTGESSEAEKPVIVRFNPWWFSGREDLARAFLHQLQAVLPGKSKAFEGLGTLLGSFAEEIGGIIDLTAGTAGGGKILGRIVAWRAKPKPKDVPALKEKIAKVLRDARIRVLVVVDDLDRLDEGEVRQFFTVIKALADFPFVTYLLAFDRDVVIAAIEQDSAFAGERYLEKIIQVPFELPPVDKVALRSVLFGQLNEVIVDTPDGLFDREDWTNVYFVGIDALIRVPRDIVRLTNTLSITYPAVVGEVNPVDFIAIESIRVFLPGLYEKIRSNPDRFAGHTSGEPGNRDREGKAAFREACAKEIPEELCASTLALMDRLFPKLRNMGYGSEWLPEWRRRLRVCHPDVFPTYFRLSLPSGSIGHQEMLAFINLIPTPDAFKARLLKAKMEKRPDGLSKAREFLERLMDHFDKDIPASWIPSAIEGLLDIGDELIDPAEVRGMFDEGNIVRVTRPVYHLVKRIEKGSRPSLLEAAIRSGRGLAVQVRLLDTLENEAKKAAAGSETALFDISDVERLKTLWLEKVRTLSGESNFVERREFRLILLAWREWGGEAEVREFCERITGTDEGLLRFLVQHLFFARSQTFGDFAVRVQPTLDPSWLEPFIDTDSCARRLSQMREQGAIPEWATEAASQFLLDFSRQQERKAPNQEERPEDEESV